MGILSFKCRNLADGRDIDDAWRWLLNAQRLLRLLRQHCSISNVHELHLAHRHLSSPDALINARSAHRNLLNCETGEIRLASIRQTIACAAAAQALIYNHQDSVSWLRAVFQIDGDGVFNNEIDGASLEEKIETTFQASKKDPHALMARSLTLQLIGLPRGSDHRVVVPVVLMNQGATEGLVATLRLQRFSQGSGHVWPCQYTQLGVEVDGETLNGAGLARDILRETNKFNFDDVDIQWTIEGTSTISGRSAEAAFAVGLYFLMRGLTVDSGLFVSASLETDGTLGSVNGISDEQSLKLHAIARQSLHVPATLCVPVSNRLATDIEVDWRSRGVHVLPCHHLKDVVQEFSRQLIHLNNLLQTQVDWILSQASERVGRPYGSIDAFLKQTISLRVARGVSVDINAMDAAIESSSDNADLPASGNEDASSIEYESIREEVGWNEYRRLKTSRTVLLGDPGFGKTTLLFQAIAEECLREQERLSQGDSRPSDATFGLYFAAADLAGRLNELPDAKNCLAAVMESIYDSYKPDNSIRELLLNFIVQGQCQLYIDALDEVTDSTDLEKGFSHLVDTYPLVRIVLTSRRTGYSGPPFSLPKSDQLELLPLTPKQIHEAIQCWFEDVSIASAICRQVDQNIHLHDVLRSPILLHLATRQLKRSIDNQSAFPTWGRRSDLYSSFVNHALEQIGRRERPKLTQMERIELKTLLQSLSLKLWTIDPKRTTWPVCEIYRHIKRIVGGLKLWGLRRRFPDLLDDLLESGLMVPIQSGDHDSPLMFLHRTIGEFLAGQCLATHCDEQTEALIFLDRKIWDPTWKQVLLFCAGCVNSPDLLLRRLINRGQQTEPDDLLEHRLLFAATCLPEVQVTDSTIATEIAERVSRIGRSESTPRLTDAFRDAIVALLAANPSVNDSHFKSTWYRRIAFSERFIPEIGTIADCAELWAWLLERLRRAISSQTSSVTGMNAQVFFLMRAIFSVRKTIDAADLFSNPDGNEYDWHQVFKLLSFAERQSDTSINITQEFLKRFLEACLSGNESRGELAGKMLERIPKLTVLDGEAGQIIEACCDTLENSGSLSSQRMAINLLIGQGPIVGTSSRLRRWIESVPVVTRERDVLELVSVIREHLKDDSTFVRLAHTVEVLPATQQSFGFRILLAVNACDRNRWVQEVVCLQESNPLLVADFESFLVTNPNRILMRVVLAFLQRHETHPVGLRLALAFSKSIGRRNSIRSVSKIGITTEEFPDVGILLAWLDSVLDKVADYSPGDGVASRRGSLEILERLLESEDLTARSIGREVLRLSCQFRQTDSLSGWIASQLASPSLDSDRIDCLAYGIANCPTIFLESIRDALLTSPIDSKLLEDYRLLPVTGLIGDSVVTKQLELARARDLKGLAETVAALLASTKDLFGESFRPVFLELLNSRRTSHREIGCRAITRLTSEAVDDDFVDRLFQSFSRESTPGSLTEAASELARRCPQCFAAKATEVFFDSSSELRDHAGVIVGELGDFFATDSNLSQLLEDVNLKLPITQASRRFRSSVRILERLMDTCSDAGRDKVFGYLIKCQDRVAVPNGGKISSRQTARWLVSQLEHPDPDRVVLAGSILARRERNRESLGPPLLVDGCDGQAEFRVGLTGHQPEQKNRITAICRRLAAVAQPYGFRFFLGNDGVDVRKTPELSVVSAAFLRG